MPQNGAAQRTQFALASNPVAHDLRNRALRITRKPSKLRMFGLRNIDLDRHPALTHGFWLCALASCHDTHYFTVMTPTPQQFVDLMNRLTQHSRELEAANSHDRSYVLGWRAATNTALVSLWAALNGNHDLPPCADEPIETLRRVICKACHCVQFKSTPDSSGCVDCGGNTLSFFRRSTDLEPADRTPEGFSEMVPKRTCNHHHEQHCGKPATVVCRTADGLEWFACDAHKHETSVPGFDLPTTATPIGEWLTKYIPPFDNADHDHELCDCLDCDNLRRAEASHDGLPQ